MKAAEKLSALECLALDTWAAYWGRNWKRELRHAWETGDYQGRDDLIGPLQTLRNSEDFGPAGLIRYVAGKGAKSIT